MDLRILTSQERIIWVFQDQTALIVRTNDQSDPPHKANLTKNYQHMILYTRATSS